MKPLSAWAQVVVSGILIAAASASHANLYQFQFYANPTALDAVPDRSLDVLHTVTIDGSKIPSFSASTLNTTAVWLNGGITGAMTYGGQTVTLNSGFDPLLPRPVMHGDFSYEGFLSLTPAHAQSFYALEFAPSSPFVDGNNLPYDPFVYGFLFVYQEDRAYEDFRKLWSGDASVLSAYQITSVPEPASTITMLIGLGAIALAMRRRKLRV